MAVTVFGVFSIVHQCTGGPQVAGVRYQYRVIGRVSRPQPQVTGNQSRTMCYTPGRGGRMWCGTASQISLDLELNLVDAVLAGYLDPTQTLSKYHGEKM